MKVIGDNEIIIMSKVYSFREKISKLLVLQALISYSIFYFLSFSDAS